MVSVLLLFSARTWDDVLYRDELLEIDRSSREFKLVLALTREPAKRDGDFGRRVDDVMIAEVLRRLPGRPKLVFVCGSNPFVNVAADSAIACKIAPQNIRTERYGI
jgi:ferredoxin-NADP reductase